MVGTRLRRRKQHEGEIDRQIVDRLVIDRLRELYDHGHHTIEPFDAAVRDRDPAAEAGRTELLAFGQRFGHNPRIEPVSLTRRRRQRLEQMLFGGGRRSEEHTSELQSLMRISYAVFCLKKKNITTTNIILYSR